MNIGILLILTCTAISTSLLGVFLVLRKMSMMVDAISHTVLLGIVIVFMLVGDLTSPLLILGAALMGMFTVFMTEIIVKTRRTSEDSAIGLVFPLLFSIAVIIISTSFQGVHLDVDAVLLGKIEFAPFDRVYVSGRSIGPRLFYIMLFTTLVNMLFIKIFFKELKIVSFDSALASTLGFLPVLIHYMLMGLVSLTSVAAFNAVGSILVVALMIGPAATAVLITKRLKWTLILAPIFGIINSVIGYALALTIDVSVSGMVATTTLITFLGVLILEPRKGLLATVLKRMRLKDQFAFMILLMHINSHTAPKEIAYDNIGHELNWVTKKYRRMMEKGLQDGYVYVSDQNVYLTDTGKHYLDLKVMELDI